MGKLFYSLTGSCIAALTTAAAAQEPTAPRSPGSTADLQQQTAASSPVPAADARPTPRLSDPTSGPIQEIVVTAQKRRETVQNTPLSITALGGAALRERNISDVRSLQSVVPNVQIGEGNGIARVAVRGIGLDASQPGAEGRVAYHIDGVYVSRPESVLDTFFDIDRVEVLRGPQGTLYGRNATGGSINVVTHDPTQTLDGYGELTIGNYGEIKTEGAIGGGLANGVAGRIAFVTENHNGYGYGGERHDLNDRNVRGVRGKLMFGRSDTLSLLLSADYFEQDDHSGTFNFIRSGVPGVPNTGQNYGAPSARNTYRDTNSDYQARSRRNDWGLSATANYKIAPDIALTSITGYRRTDFKLNWDQDSTAYPLAAFNPFIKSRMFSEELRLGGKVGRFGFVLGGYYFQETGHPGGTDIYDRVLFIPSTTPLIVQGYEVGATLKTQAAAAFGQVNYEFTDKLGLDIGLRYSWERKEKINEFFAFDLVHPYVPGGMPDLASGFPQNPIPFDSRSDTALNPKVTIRYKPRTAILMYATYSQGFKSGGFNVGAMQPSFKPEKLTDYECGIKADWFGGRLRTNLSGFYYDYKNLQVSKTVFNSIVVENAAAAELYGVEAEIIAVPVREVRIDIGGGLLHTKYKNFSSADPLYPLYGAPGTTAPEIDLSGNKLQQAPGHNINVGAQYTWFTGRGDITLRGEGHFVGRTYFTSFNTEPFSQKPYSRFDLLINFESTSKRIYGGLFLRNVTDQDVLSSATNNIPALGGTVLGVVLPPRTFGARLGYRF